MAQPHISVAAETIFNASPLPVTNSLLSTWVVMALLAVIAFWTSANLKKNPGKVQLTIELLVGGFYGFFRNLGGKHGNKIAPLATTLFLFIVASNWFGLLPGVGTIGMWEGEGASEASRIVHQVKATEAVEETHDTVPVQSEQGMEPREVQQVESDHEIPTEHGESATAESHGPKLVPFFRGPTADLNTTLALGLIAFFSIQYFGFTLAGFSYIKRFFDLRSPIFFFVGILEAVSDLSKVLSFAFRLFGNVFAGEVLLAIMAFLFAFFLPIPFYGLELFVGVIQGLVFAMLTTVFTSIAVAHGEHMSGSHEHAHSDHQV